MNSNLQICLKYRINGMIRIQNSEIHTVKYGKHSLRYLGSILWSKVNEKERTSPCVENFRNCITKKDLEALLNDNVRGEHCGICHFS